MTTAKVMVMEQMLNATKKIKGHKFDSTKSSMPILALKSVAARQIFLCPPTSSRCVAQRRFQLPALWNDLTALHRQFLSNLKRSTAGTGILCSKATFRRLRIGRKVPARWITLAKTITRSHSDFATAD
jgi:hypothetical protein